MPGHKNRPKPPPCSAARKDGSPCNSYSVEDGLCAFHVRQRDNPPSPKKPPVSVEFKALEAAEDDAVAASSSASGGIRQRLRTAADDLTPLIVSSLEEALHASKPFRVACSCGQTTTVRFPDATARTAAADKLVQLGYGKPPQEAQEETLDLDKVARLDISTLPKDERDRLHESLARQYPEVYERVTKAMLARAAPPAARPAVRPKRSKADADPR